MQLFDYKTIACQAGVTGEQLDELCNVIRKEFPRDEMMFELHVLRACMAIRDGHARLSDWFAVHAV